MSRLNASCLECGETLAPSVQNREFCCAPCRQAWNNRRMQRGGAVFDLYMALRHDRATATVLKVWRLLNRLCAEFREEDRRERAGRRSWRPAAVVLEERPFLKAIAQRFRAGR